MEEALLDVRAGIKAGRYVKEATVSQGIVQCLLNTLGWPVYDTEVVAPEYSLGNRRADYALCHPPREPVILVEVKPKVTTPGSTGSSSATSRRTPCSATSASPTNRGPTPARGGCSMAKDRTKANGEGTIYRRGRGYCGQYHLVARDGTKKRRSVYAKTRAEAAEKLAAAVADRDRGLAFDAGGLTLGAYLDRYLDYDARGRLRPKPFNRSEGLVRNHIKPALGRVKLGDSPPPTCEPCTRPSWARGSRAGRSATSTSPCTPLSRPPSSTASSPATPLRPSSRLGWTSGR